MIQTTQYLQLQPEYRMTMAIMRELGRNTLAALPYGSHVAQLAWARRRQQAD